MARTAVSHPCSPPCSLGSILPSVATDILVWSNISNAPRIFHQRSRPMPTGTHSHQQRRIFQSRCKPPGEGQVEWCRVLH